MLPFGLSHVPRPLKAVGHWLFDYTNITFAGADNLFPLLLRWIAY